MARILNPTIGGLPASDFIGLRVKARVGQWDPQPNVVRVVAITDRGQVKISADSGRRQATVDPKVIDPWWTENTTLHEKWKALQKEPIRVAPEVDSLVLDDVLNQPVTLIPNDIRMSVSILPELTNKVIKSVHAPADLDDGWLDTYRDLKKIMANLSTRQAALDKLQRELKEDTGLVALYAQELHDKGVTIEWADAP